MLSKSQIRFITSLQHKKFRKEHGLFIVEGLKSITEFAHSNYPVHEIFSTPQAGAKMGKIPQNIKFIEVSETDFQRISTLKNPQGILALVGIPENRALSGDELMGRFHLLLDGVQDPGNLGTLIRTAEWFGFECIICSLDTADAYNPKVVQASMGSLSRVKAVYTDIEQLVRETNLPVFGAVLDGEPIYEMDWGDEGLIILGNEGNGIRNSLLPHIQYPVTIPKLGMAESLNVAISAALFCAELARKGKKINPL